MSEPAVQILLIDHLDSFSYNLVDAFACRGADVRVWRHHAGADRLLEECSRLTLPRLVVLSPGPGAPQDYPETLELIGRLPENVPLFGVCLGMQMIVSAYGGTTGPTPLRQHGKSSTIEHDGGGIFQDLPKSLSVGRYHSLAAQEVPPPLHVTATAAGLPMAVQHERLPRFGVQFHPESVLTTYGERLLHRVLGECR